MTREEKLQIIEIARTFSAGAMQDFLKASQDDDASEKSLLDLLTVAGNCATVMSAFIADLD
jgi:hypothetical protein